MKKILTVLAIVFGLVLASCTPSVVTVPIDCEEWETNIEGVCIDEIEQNIDDFYPGEGVVYQIFVRSFADSDGDGIGDFIGIKENLNYFTELGVDTLWLMPIHPSPTYHGYDVLDYYDVNPEYGTMADFDALVAAADEAGIDIILDFLINHTSTSHEWFTGWLAGDSQYEDYYRSISSSDPRYDLDSSSWHSIGDGQYYYGYFHEMADLNWSNPAVQEQMIDAALFWLDKGVDGFRLDAVKHLEYYGEVSVGTQSITSTLNKLQLFEYRLEEEYPDVYISGEVFSYDFTELKLFYQSVDSVLNFTTSGTILRSLNNRTASSYVADIISQYDQMKNIDPEAIDAPFLYNHDQDRLATIVNGDMRKLKLAAEMLLTLEGNPHLYYGEEIGMYGYKSSGPFWDETRRLPLKWGNDFTTSWHPDTINGTVASIEDQFLDPDSLLNVYKNVMRTRQISPALRYGEVVESEYSNNALVSYYRVLNHDENHQYKVLVVHNVSEYEYQLGEMEGTILYYSNGLRNYEGTVSPSSTLIIEVPYSE